MNRVSHPLLIAALLVSMAGCAGPNISARLTQALVNGDCPGARNLIDTSSKAYGANAELLYLLDGAMVSLECRAYTDAQDKLHKAEALAEDLWTKSISRNAAAYLSSDYVLKYSGEDYERVMIHIVSAIGYLETDQLDEALVEIRRLNTLLNTYVDEYKGDQFYKTDAFARYLSGIIREADGEYDGAFIDYYQAVAAYQDENDLYPFPLPEMLARDLLRLAAKVDRMEDARRLLPRADGVDEASMAASPGMGKVVLIVFSGDTPQKIQDTIVIPSPVGPISVAFPRVVPGGNVCSGGHFALVGSEGDVTGQVTLVSDINLIAVKSLEQKKGRIIAKAIARAVAKQAAIQGVASTQRKGDRELVSVALNVLNLLALEKADVRSWRTLPGQILLARLFVKPGTYSGRLDFCGYAHVALGDVEVAAGTTRFLFFDARYSGLGH